MTQWGSISAWRWSRRDPLHRKLLSSGETWASALRSAVIIQTSPQTQSTSQIQRFTPLPPGTSREHRDSGEVQRKSSPVGPIQFWVSSTDARTQCLGVGRVNTILRSRASKPTLLEGAGPLYLPSQGHGAPMKASKTLGVHCSLENLKIMEPLARKPMAASVCRLHYCSHQADKFPRDMTRRDSFPPSIEDECPPRALTCARY